jgi:hypothetical protein
MKRSQMPLRFVLDTALDLHRGQVGSDAMSNRFISAVLPVDLATDPRYALAALVNDFIDQAILLGLLS